MLRGGGIIFVGKLTIFKNDIQQPLCKSDIRALELLSVLLKSIKKT